MQGMGGQSMSLIKVDAGLVKKVSVKNDRDCGNREQNQRVAVGMPGALFSDAEGREDQVQDVVRRGGAR